MSAVWDIGPTVRESLKPFIFNRSKVSDYRRAAFSVGILQAGNADGMTVCRGQRVCPCTIRIAYAQMMSAVDSADPSYCISGYLIHCRSAAGFCTSL